MRHALSTYGTTMHVIFISIHTAATNDPGPPLPPQETLEGQGLHHRAQAVTLRLLYTCVNISTDGTYFLIGHAVSRL